eukprot:7376707-Prymnesium_polylepis.1
MRSLCNSRTVISSSSLPVRSFLPVSGLSTSKVSLAMGELTTRGCARIQSRSASRISAVTFLWPRRLLTCDHETPSARSVSFARFAAAFLSSRFAVLKPMPASVLSTRARALRLGTSPPGLEGDAATATPTASTKPRRSLLTLPRFLSVSVARLSMRAICC